LKEKDREIEIVGSSEESGEESVEEAPAPKMKKELNRAPIKEESDDDEYDDEEEAPQKKKRLVSQHYDLTNAKNSKVMTTILHMPTDPYDPISWDVVMLKQAIVDEEFDPPQGADRYVKEALKMEEKEKENGITCKKGGKGGKHGPFYWGPHDELDFEGPVPFEDAYDSEKNLINKNGIRRYLVVDVFTMPCSKCASAARPCFFAGGVPKPLGRCSVDELQLNSMCSPCKEAHHKSTGCSRLRQQTIIDNPFYKEGAYYKPEKKPVKKPKAKAVKGAAAKDTVPKATTKVAVPKTAAPKTAMPKVTVPKATVPTVTASTPAAANVAGPSKSTPIESMPKPKPRLLEKPIASPSNTVPSENGKFLSIKSSHLN